MMVRSGVCQPESAVFSSLPTQLPKSSIGLAGLRGRAFACKPVHDSYRGRDCLQKVLWALTAAV